MIRVPLMIEYRVDSIREENFYTLLGHQTVRQTYLFHLKIHM